MAATTLCHAEIVRAAVRRWRPIRKQGWPGQAAGFLDARRAANNLSAAASINNSSCVFFKKLQTPSVKGVTHSAADIKRKTMLVYTPVHATPTHGRALSQARVFPSENPQL